VAEVLGEVFPCRMKRIGVQDEFGEVGDLPYLQKRYGFTASDIRDKIREFLSRNGN
jgi:transketolase